MQIYENILNEKQKEIITKLNFLGDLGFYLAGGTALALQLGHRTSLDFDFKFFSIGRVIKFSISDGDVPGYIVVTSIFGNTISGNCSFGMLV